MAPKIAASKGKGKKVASSSGDATAPLPIILEAVMVGAPSTEAGEGEGPLLGEDFFRTEPKEFAHVGESFECLRCDIVEHLSQSFGISTRSLDPETIATIKEAISGDPTEVVNIPGSDEELLAWLGP
ncbi:uncharacterized protein A4U43_C03F29380 [Asparagus officinalis]|uniref:Uncharacterized protein n=1 Tax=Asparagus officinalis TaxID=4686 RepID=A0A5P1FER7_ASPOF|nr:uncharacterized protein A4U43_C03F29380 [Asparagus officinalis]